MLFRRRNRASLGERLQCWFWPRRGWRRAAEYVFYRVSRLSGSPHTIAIGFSAGVFASFTPFMGLHFMIGFVLAFALGGSLLASALGTFAGNPVTFPFIWIMTYNFGMFLLGMEGSDQVDIELSSSAWWMLFNDPRGLWVEFWNNLWPLIRPMTIGGVPLGALAGTIVYFPIRYAVGVYQRRRQERLAKRALRDRRTAHEAKANG